MLIPKPQKPRMSFNTERSYSPYYDNIFIYLKFIKENFEHNKCTNAKFDELFRKTKEFWNLFNNFDNYIKTFNLQPFTSKNIPQKLYKSPGEWDTKTLNLYITTLNKCIIERTNSLNTILNINNL